LNALWGIALLYRYKKILEILLGETLNGLIDTKVDWELFKGRKNLLVRLSKTL
jgi:hypothetical protein